jgi:hypothetical protein
LKAAELARPAAARPRSRRYSPCLDAIGKSRLFLHGRLMHGLKLIVAMFLGTLVIVFLGKRGEIRAGC